MYWIDLLGFNREWNSLRTFSGSKMNIKLKHLLKVNKRLANGTTKHYYYYRKNMRRVHGEYGSPEFLYSYAQAAKYDSSKLDANLDGLIGRYLLSGEYSELMPRTKKDYSKWLDKIREKFGTMPIIVLNDKRVRGDFKKWRAEIAKSSRKQADYMWSVIRLVVKWGCDHGELASNHFTNPAVCTRVTDQT